MARKTVITLVDDISGETVQKGEGETVHFSLKGTDYEIDLGTRNAKNFADAMSIYVDHARRVGTRRTPQRTRVPTEVDVSAVRAWAGSHGIAVSSRGRLSASVIEQFRAAGN